MVLANYWNTQLAWVFECWCSICGCLFWCPCYFRCLILNPFSLCGLKLHFIPQRVKDKTNYTASTTENVGWPCRECWRTQDPESSSAHLFPELQWLPGRQRGGRSILMVPVGSGEWERWRLGEAAARKPGLEENCGLKSCLPWEWNLFLLYLRHHLCFQAGTFKCLSLSCVWFFVTPWTVALQAPLSMEFSRQEYWSGLPFPSTRALPDPGIELSSPALQADSTI